MKLDRRYVEKPWGRRDLPQIFDPPDDKVIGEIWFVGEEDEPLLAKYLFTSERLSVQVHPNDEQARARGLARGKTECWYILEAEPGAVLGVGLTHEVEKEELRAAALDGSIERLIEWNEVRSGDFLLVPPGTVHAIGSGITLLEFQVNSDVTYRLYDYGRPRELHLDDGIAVAIAGPFTGKIEHVADKGERSLVEGPPFVLVKTPTDALNDRQRWVIPLEGEVRSGRDSAQAGECLLVEAGEPIESIGATMLIGATS